MNITFKNIRLLHSSLNHQRKYHIFKLFQKEEVNSPFEYKGEDQQNDKNKKKSSIDSSEKVQSAKEQISTFETSKILNEKEKHKIKKSFDNKSNENDNNNNQQQSTAESQEQKLDNIHQSSSKQQQQVESQNNIQSEQNNNSNNINQQKQDKQQNESNEQQLKQQQEQWSVEQNINQDAQEIQLGNIQKNKFEYQKQELKKSMLPPFQQLDDGLIHQFTMYSKNIQLHSPYRWTPYIQNQDIYDREFQLKMKQFKKKKIFEVTDEAELIDTFLFQALKNTGFDYYYDYICQPSKSCPFHGRIDYLIYHRDHETKVPLVPILRARKEKNSLGEWEDKFNQAELLGAALWALTNMKARDPTITTCRAIQTNGNAWRMIQINDKGEFEKTATYIAQNDEYNKIYRDEAAQSLALGLIKFALNQPTENELALKKIYDFVDERKYLTDLDDDTKSKLDSINKTYFFLPKFVRDFFFGYK